MPRPTTVPAVTSRKRSSESAVDSDSSICSRTRAGSWSSSFSRFSSSASAAETSATAAIEFTYVFVAATARSWPAQSATTRSAATASRDVGSFVIAIVGQPWARASETTAAMSGDAPDCEMPMTSADSSRGGVR